MIWYDKGMACCCVSFLSRIFDFDFLAFDHGQSVPAAKAVRYGEIDSRQFMHFVIDLAWLNLPISKGQKLQMHFSLPDRADGF